MGCEECKKIGSNWVHYVFVFHIDMLVVVIISQIRSKIFLEKQDIDLILLDEVMSDGRSL